MDASGDSDDGAQAMAGPVAASDLLAAGIEALAHADAAGLERLAAMAGEVRGSMTVEERRLAREPRRALELLLTLTRRNLRLLRGTRAAGYGPLPD